MRRGVRFRIRLASLESLAPWLGNLGLIGLQSHNPFEGAVPKMGAAQRVRGMACMEAGSTS